MTESQDKTEANLPNADHLRELDVFVEKATLKERLTFAQDIYNVRTELLTSLDVEPVKNETTTVDAKGRVAFSHPERIEAARHALAQDIYEAVTTYEKAPNKKTFVRAFGSIVALGELSLFSPKSIHESVEFAKADQTVMAGVNPKQIDAMVSLFTSHSTRVESGQGKSNPDAVVASMAKVLLRKAQVHLYVNDEYARERDSAQIKKMAEILTLPTFVFKETEFTAKDASIYNSLVEQRTMLSVLNETPNRSVKLRTIEKTISAYERGFAIARARNALMPDEQPPSPAIAVGTNDDFKFAYLRGEHPELFTGRIEGINDEGDLPWRSDSVNVIENPGTNAIEQYLPDWIAMAVADEVCTKQLKRGDIIVDKGQYTFKDSDDVDAEKRYIKAFAKRMTALQQTGTLPESLQLALTDRMLEKQKALPERFRLTTNDVHLAIKNLVKKFAVIPMGDDEDNVDIDGTFTFYASAWMQARPLKDGTEFSAEKNAVTIIDRHTGTQLASQRYQDLLDVAVDVTHGVCMMRPRGNGSEASTGHLSYVDTVYGKKNFAVLSATMQGISEEINKFQEHPVVESERWIGEGVPTPDPYIVDTRKQAIDLLKLMVKSSQPHLVVTDNDHEVLAIKAAILASLPKNTPIVISTVTSKTTVEEEKQIYDKAGEIFHITIANPKAGRMIDIKTTKDADTLGGLRVVAWGPLYSNDVLYQVLQRTKRAGHPGEAAWIVYKRKGDVALEDHRLLAMYPEYMEQLQKLQSGTSFPYEDSLLETLHIKQFEMTTARRLQIYYEDIVRKILTWDITDRITSKLTISEGHIATIDEHILATPSYVKKFVAKQMPLIQQVAHAQARSITLTRSFTEINSFVRVLAEQQSALSQVAREMIKDELNSQIARNVHKLRLDAIVTANRWKELRASVESSGEAMSAPVDRPQKTSLGLQPLTIAPDGSERLIAGEFTSASDSEYFLVPEMPNMLISLEKKLIRHDSAKTKNKPIYHQLTFRLTLIEPTSQSIDDDIVIPIISRVTKTGKLYMIDQGILKQHLDLFLNSLSNRGASKESISKIRKQLKHRRISAFGRKQAFN